MSLVETEYEHIILNERGIATIEDTSLKVIELIIEKLAYGWSPEELHFQHPYLTLGQIHSALAYYWDHSKEIDKEIFDRLKNVEKIRKRIGSSPLIAKLKSQDLI